MPAKQEAAKPHLDLVGREIKIGDVVVTPGYNSLSVARVVDLTPKMVRVSKLRRSSTTLKYPYDVVVLEGSDVTMYLLRNS